MIGIGLIGQDHKDLIILAAVLIPCGQDGWGGPFHLDCAQPAAHFRQGLTLLGPCGDCAEGIQRIEPVLGAGGGGTVLQRELELGR